VCLLLFYQFAIQYFRIYIAFPWVTRWIRDRNAFIFDQLSDQLYLCPKTVTDVLENWTNCIAAVERVNWGSTGHSFYLYFLINTISSYLPRANTCKKVGKCLTLNKQTGQGINSATQIPLFLQVHSIITVLFFALLCVSKTFSATGHYYLDYAWLLKYSFVKVDVDQAWPLAKKCTYIYLFVKTSVGKSTNISVITNRVI
jgi:hypothetical protein